jgi:hypothetical protein
MSLWHPEFERSDWLGYFIASLAGGAPSLGEIDIRVHLGTLEDVHRINWRCVDVLCTKTALRSLESITIRVVVLANTSFVRDRVALPSTALVSRLKGASCALTLWTLMPILWISVYSLLFLRSLRCMPTPPSTAAYASAKLAFTWCVPLFHSVMRA